MNKLIAFAVGAAFAAPAMSQQQPPIWHQGKPPAQAESKLAPHAGKMTETPASEIPIDKLKLPAGFKAEIWASGLPGGARHGDLRRRQESLRRHARHRPRLRGNRRRRASAPCAWWSTS